MAMSGKVFRKAVVAVQDNPVNIGIAGIRVQLPRSQALKLYRDKHVRTHISPDGSDVRYPVPVYTSGPTASALLEKDVEATQIAVPAAVIDSLASQLANAGLR